MNADRTPLFCDAALAERIERVDVQLVTKAQRGGPPSPAGRAGLPDPRRRRRRELRRGGLAVQQGRGPRLRRRAGRSRSRRDRAGLRRLRMHPYRSSSRTSPIRRSALCLSERGYRLESFENVLGRAISGRAASASRRRGSRSAAAATTSSTPGWRSQADAAAHPDTQGVPWHEEFPREVYLRAERDMAAAGVRALRRAARRGARRRRPACASPRASRSSPGRPPHPRTAAAASRPRCSRPGSSTPRRRAATSPSSSPSRHRSPSRTRSAGVSTCSTPAPCWSRQP